MKSIMEEASSISKAIENAWNRAGQPQEFSVKILEHPKTTFFGLKTSKSAKIAFFFNEVIQKSREHPAQRQPQQRPLASNKPGHDNTTPRRPLNQARPERPDRQERNERPERPERNERTEGRHDHRRQETQQDQIQPRRQERAERPERPQHSQDRQERAERPDASTRLRQGYAGQASQEPLVSSEAERSARSENRQDYKDSRRQPDDRRERRPDDHRYDRRDNRDTREHSERPTFNDENRDTWTPEMVQNAQEWVKETLVLMGKPDINVIPQVSNNYLKLSLDNQVSDDIRHEETQLKSWASLAMESLREKTNKPLRGLRIVLESKK
jgi:hypothetical protein